MIARRVTDGNRISDIMAITPRASRTNYRVNTYTFSKSTTMGAPDSGENIRCLTFIRKATADRPNPPESYAFERRAPVDNGARKRSRPLYEEHKTNHRTIRVLGKNPFSDFCETPLTSAAQPDRRESRAAVRAH